MGLYELVMGFMGLYRGFERVGFEGPVGFCIRFKGVS